VRLKPDEIKRLSSHLSNLIFQEKTISLKADRKKIVDTIESELSHHFDEERQIDAEADRLLKEREAEFSLNDRAKALLRIRKQLAEQKNFILSGGGESRFSEDKIYHIAHLVADRLYDDDLLDFPDEDDGPKFVKKVFLQYFSQEDQAVEKVRKKIQSMGNAPLEGSRDWDVLYRKFLEEELRRLGR
jgi:hypothetical protein